MSFNSLGNYVTNEFGPTTTFENCGAAQEFKKFDTTKQFNSTQSYFQIGDYAMINKEIYYIVGTSGFRTLVYYPNPQDEPAQEYIAINFTKQTVEQIENQKCSILTYAKPKSEIINDSVAARDIVQQELDSLMEAFNYNFSNDPVFANEAYGQLIADLENQIKNYNEKINNLQSNSH